MFVKYPHVVKLSDSEVEGILNGDCYIFPKLDGSNASVWFEDGEVKCGSRTRALSLTSDNAGFWAYIHGKSDEAVFIRKFVEDHPDMIVYGEWLGTKNQIRDYLQPDRFWVFDIRYNPGNLGDRDEYKGFIDYPAMVELLDGYPYIVHPLGFVKNPSVDELEKMMMDNHFNLPESVVGEGIVIKNYGFRNVYGRYAVAKMVTDQYHQRKVTKKTTPVIDGIEYVIVRDLLFPSELEKAKWKVVNALGESEFNKTNGKMIGMIIGEVWHSFVEDEIFFILKKYKNPTINFQTLNKLVQTEVRKFLGLI